MLKCIFFFLNILFENYLKTLERYRFNFLFNLAPMPKSTHIDIYIHMYYCICTLRECPHPFPLWGVLPNDINGRKKFEIADKCNCICMQLSSQWRDCRERGSKELRFFFFFLYSTLHTYMYVCMYHIIHCTNA